MTTISVHVGGCGGKIGAAFWSGLIEERSSASEAAVPITETSHFYETDSSETRWVPQAVFIDTHDAGADRLRATPIGNQFSPDSFVTCNDASCGLWTLPRENSLLLETSMDAIRRRAELCDRVGHIMITHASSGGTGSGVVSSLLRQLYEESYFTLTTSVFPDCNAFLPSWEASLAASSTTSAASVINSVLVMNDLIEDSRGTIAFTNTALERCASATGTMTGSHRGFYHENRVVRQALTALEGTHRYASSGFRASPQGIIQNLVPFTRMHFMTAACATAVPSGLRDPTNTADVNEAREELATQLYDVRRWGCGSDFAAVDQRCTYSSAVIQRGPGSFDYGFSFALEKARVATNIRQVEWIPPAHVMSTTGVADNAANLRSATLITHSNSFHPVVSSLNRACDALLDRRNKAASRSFMHRYEAAGTTAAEIFEANISLADMISTYNAYFFATVEAEDGEFSEEDGEY